MKKKEWSLIINSLMLQFAVGTITLIAFYRALFAADLGDEAVTSMTSAGLFFVGPVGVAGIIAAFFHLGSPTRAFRSLNNIKTSWLSREIFFTNVFLGLWFVTYALEFLGRPNTLLLWLSLIAGMLALWSMASIYYVTKRPGWFCANTYVGFFGSALVLGCVGLALTLSIANLEKRGGMGLLLVASFAAIAVLMVRLVLELKLIPTLKPTQAKPSFNNLACAARKISNDVPRYRRLAIGGMSSSIVGGLVLLMLVQNGGNGLGLATVIAPALLIIVGELSSRLGFYSLGPHK